MCGIAGFISLDRSPVPNPRRKLEVMNELQRHRGPDGEGIWVHPRGHTGFAHRRLAIIDAAGGGQPMTDGAGLWITFNGEIYNHVELREELGKENFRTASDTEVILHAWRRWGKDCLNRFQGMFAFALWDEEKQALFCARDRFGIKPFYYARAGETLLFASEIKALLPFTGPIETDLEAMKDYLSFQFCLAGKTLFKGIAELPPGHCIGVSNGNVSVSRYWEVYYNLDFDHKPEYFSERLRSLIAESVDLHLRSDVPLGAYVSGGLDSSIIASLASRKSRNPLVGFVGRFADGPEYDESGYARMLADSCGFDLHVVDVTADDFIRDMRKLIYHMDFPVAGPGSLPQYVVSRYAGRHRKVLLGGQGGDETFGGYTRYLIAYFEQCIKAAIDGTMHGGKFVVTYESIIPSLTALASYKPMLQHFWRDGLFDDMDRRYFRLVNRAPDLGPEVNWDLLGRYSPFETFRSIFYGDNVRKESYFDLMTHFDFKTLLPALLHVEDRVSMAHGLESRVPFLYHPLVEFAATIPADVKFKDGMMKHALRSAMKEILPPAIYDRRDKMGFPVPLNAWINGPAREFVNDIFSSAKALSRPLFDNRRVLDGLEREPKFGRKIWGLLCLELWQEQFHDRESEFRKLAC